MAPAPTPPPNPACFRCSKPIKPGTGSQLWGRPVHMRCLAAETQVTSIEQQDRASRETERAAAAINVATGLVNTVRRKHTHCPACGEPFAMSRSVLFQGDQLVHAGCWRVDPPPV